MPHTKTPGGQQMSDKQAKRDAQSMQPLAFSHLSSPSLVIPPTNIHQHTAPAPPMHQATPNLRPQAKPLSLPTADQRT